MSVCRQKQLPEIENAVRTYMANNKIELGDSESLEHALEKFAEDPEIVRLQQELNALMQTYVAC